MSLQRIYSPEDIVHDCRVIEAIWEALRHDLKNKTQLAVTYATCSTMADLIRIKIDNVQSDSDGPIWLEGTGRGYFLEKLISALGDFGNLAEKALADQDYECEKYFVFASISKLRNALPNFEDGYKAFVRHETLE
jgi:hypothetical protein